MLKLGEKKYKINFSEAYIDDGIVGNVGDNETRNLKITIMGENNEVIKDTDIKLELLCCPLGEDNIYKSSAELEGDIYTIKYPNSIFTKNQKVKMQIVARKNNQQISTPIFTKEVKKSILGEVATDRDIYLDLDRVHNLSIEYELKVLELNSIKQEAEKYSLNAKSSENNAEKFKNSIAKTKEQIEAELREASNLVTKVDEKKDVAIENINSRVANIIETCNNELLQTTTNKKNEITKLSDEKKEEITVVKNNYTQGLKNLNEALSQGILNFADNKISEYDHNHAEKLKILDNYKTNIDEKVGTFNEKYPLVENLLNSEEKRINAENKRKEHDARLQRIFSEGLNSELGEYAKKTDLNKFITNENYNSVRRELSNFTIIPGLGVSGSQIHFDICPELTDKNKGFLMSVAPWHNFSLYDIKLQKTTYELTDKEAIYYLPVNMSGQSIKNIKMPEHENEATNKKYVDDKINSVDDVAYEELSETDIDVIFNTLSSLNGFQEIESLPLEEKKKTLSNLFNANIANVTNKAQLLKLITTQLAVINLWAVSMPIEMKLEVNRISDLNKTFQIDTNKNLQIIQEKMSKEIQDFYEDHFDDGYAKFSKSIENKNTNGNISIWVGTEKEYNSISTKKEDTLYFIKE